MVRRISVFASAVIFASLTAVAYEKSCLERMRHCLERHIEWLNSPSPKIISYTVETKGITGPATVDTVKVVSAPGYYYSTSSTSILGIDETILVSVVHPSKTILIRKVQARSSELSSRWTLLVSEIMNRKVVKCQVASSEVIYVTNPIAKSSSTAEFQMEQLSIVVDSSSCRLVEIQRTFNANGDKQLQRMTLERSEETSDLSTNRIDPVRIVFDSKGKLTPAFAHYKLIDLR